MEVAKLGTVQFPASFCGVIVSELYSTLSKCHAIGAASVKWLVQE